PASGAGASASSKAAGGGAAKEPARPSRSDDGPDVIARLIERADSKATAGAAPAVQRKFLVQIGAYSNVQSARNMSDRAVQAGLRPYQETVKTAQGDWIRVRVGPFPTRQDAERAQQDLKRAGVTAAIIAL
ncbi:MAG: SPOR domain-containing protein, partial [Burkholderiaceae bacterium]|nr:SPOR domain-containing protein [Burkholderiaceae bacterium]